MCVLCAIHTQRIIVIFKNLALMQQFAIFSCKFLFISLRRSLTDTSIILLANCD